MSRMGWRISWLVIVASSVFMAGYLLRYAGPATGEGVAVAQQAVGSPSETPAPAQAAPGRAAAPAAPVAPTRPPGPTSATPAPAVATSPSATRAAAMPGAGAGEPATKADTTPAPSSAPPSPQPAPPLSQSPLPEDAPRITFAETVYDWGTMYQDQEVTHEYAFTNTGKSLLRISSVSSGCGCTPVMPSKKELAPGEAGTITATFRSGRYRDRVTKHINVNSTDPVQPRVVLTLMGIVKAELEVAPSSVYVGNLRIGEAVERLVILSPVEVKKFAILEVKAESPLVQVSTPEPVPGKEGSYQFKVTFGPADKVGRVNTKVIVRTDLPHTREAAISVFGRIVEKEPPSAPAPAQP